MELRSEQFFDDEGILAKKDWLIFRKPEKKDLMGYIEAFGVRSPGLAKEYLRDDEWGQSLRDSYWEAVEDQDALFCTIETERGKFCGYCNIHRLSENPPEIGIDLLPAYQGRGIGPRAVNALMDAFEKKAGCTAFVAEIEPENKNSQKMFRRLGFAPAGITTFLIKDPTMLEAFEESRMDEITDDMHYLAEEFGVEPRKLLSHLLVFKREDVSGSPHIPETHRKYNLLPDSRKDHYEVFSYPPELNDIDSRIWLSKHPDFDEENEMRGALIMPYGERSYGTYNAVLDGYIAEFALADPQLADDLRSLKEKVRKMNVKENWSVVKYTGPDLPRALGLKNGQCYYWPCSLENPEYEGVIDEEEFTSYLYPCDPDCWEILEDPTGMAERALSGKADTVIHRSKRP